MRLTILGLAMLLISGLASVGVAQTSSAMSVEGTVVSSTATSLTVRTDTGEERTFTVEATSQLPGMLSPGNRIRVEYHNTGGVLHAGTVTRMESVTDTRTEATTSTSVDDDLPGTAGSGPAMLLLGLLAFGGAAFVRLASRRT
jgi:hypothetical protein